jgi:hypothetical protein
MSGSQIKGAGGPVNPAIVFLQSALEKLLSIKDVKRLPKLKEACTSSLCMRSNERSLKKQTEFCFLFGILC